MSAVAKHVLIVEPPNGTLCQLAPALRAFGFDVEAVSDLGAARARVESTVLLALVAIDGAIGEAEGAALLMSIKDQHTDLPVVWVGTRAWPAPVSLCGHAPDIFIKHPVDVDALKEDVEALLCQHSYSQALREHLASCCELAMRRACQVDLSLTGVHIRANRTALGEVTAILPFVGRRLSGRLLVGSDRAALARIRASALGAQALASEAEIDDVAGEFANVVVGRVKEHFVAQGLDFAVGTPVVVSGAGSTLSYRGSRPTLVLSFASDVGDIRVALCFDVLGQADASVAVDRREVVATGELVFL